MLHLAVGVQSVLELIPARWRNLNVPVHSFICISDFQIYFRFPLKNGISVGTFSK